MKGLDRKIDRKKKMLIDGWNVAGREILGIKKKMGLKEKIKVEGDVYKKGSRKVIFEIVWVILKNMS